MATGRLLSTLGGLARAWVQGRGAWLLVGTYGRAYDPEKRRRKRMRSVVKRGVKLKGLRLLIKDANVYFIYFVSRRKRTPYKRREKVGRKME